MPEPGERGRFLFRWCPFCRRMTKRIVGSGDGGPCPECRRGDRAATRRIDDRRQLRMFGPQK